MTEEHEQIVSGGGWKSRHHADREHLGLLLGLATISALLGSVALIGGLAMADNDYWLIGLGIFGLIMVPVFLNAAHRVELGAKGTE
jgi:hypothetical protein